MDLCCRKNLPQGDVPKDDHPDQALAAHELIESHSGPAAKTTSAGLNWPLTAGLLEEVAWHQLILEFLLVHRWRRCLSPGAGGPQVASGFIFDHRLPRLIALLEGVVLIVKPALHIVDQERYG